MIKFASIILIIQNISILAILLTIPYGSSWLGQDFNNDSFLLKSAAIILTLDIVGYTLLAFGWFKHQKMVTDIYRKQIVAGIALIGWVIVSIYARLNFMIRDVETTRIFGSDGYFYLLLTLSSLFLFFSGLTRINNRYFAYTTVNFVCGLALLGYYSSTEMIKIFSTIGVVFKIFFVPVFGVIAFWSLYANNLGESYQTRNSPPANEISIV